MQDNGLVVEIQDILLPSHLSEIHLSHQGTDALEILLTIIAGRKACRHATQLSLRNLWYKGDGTHGVTTIETDSKVSPVFSHLSKRE